MMRALAFLVCGVTLLGPRPAAAGCELDGQRAIAGSPLSYWVIEETSQDWPRMRAARQALRENPVDALAAILAAKVETANRPAGRGRHKSFRELFEGAGNAVPLLTSYIECEEPVVREMALQLLGWIGPAAKQAVPAVAEALDDEDHGVRMQAGFTIARIGVVNDNVLRALRDTLDDENWRAANASASALAAFWPQSRGTLIEALRGDPPGERFHAMRTLQKIKDFDDTEIVTTLVERASRDVTWNRAEAVKTLRGLEPALVAPHLSRLTPLLDDEAARCEAARLLVGRVGPELEAALIRAFVDLMRQPKSPQRNECHDEIHEDVFRLGPSTVEPLAILLHHPEPRVRCNALSAISAIEPRPAAVYDHYRSVLEDAELRSRLISQLGKSGAEALPTLRAMLKHEDPAVRDAAAQAATRLGPQARPLVPLLVERLSLESGVTRNHFIRALGSTAGGGDLPERQTEAVVSELRRAAADPGYHEQAVSALARIQGPAAVALVPDLVAALREQSQGMCPHPTAPDDLRAIGPVAAPAIVKALENGATPAGPLVGLLEEWGTLATAAPILERWVRDNDSMALRAAEWLQQLGKLDPVAGEAVFDRALESSNAWMRLSGAVGLVRLGGDGCVRAKTVLADFADHRHENWRRRAQESMGLPCD